MRKFRGDAPLVILGKRLELTGRPVRLPRSSAHRQLYNNGFSDGTTAAKFNDSLYVPGQGSSSLLFFPSSWGNGRKTLP
jgi:hypothetical protein